VLRPAHRTPAAPRTDVLVLCPPLEARLYRKPLAPTCRVKTTPSADAALESVIQYEPPLLIVDGDADQSGPGVFCDIVRRLPTPPAVLVTPITPDHAAQVVDKCDSILFKPFRPNQLVSRATLLLQTSQRLPARAETAAAAAPGAVARATTLIEQRRSVGTMLESPDTQCPYCGHIGVTLFDSISERRAWCACAACRKAWVEPRVEPRE
jgi:hypothetical protein